MKYFISLVLTALQCVTLLEYTWGHGMMLNPPGRSSRWRFDRSAPINYDDNANFCGGIKAQWQVNGGKCGLCGDNYSAPRPRKNELGGKYGGSGVIVKTYKNPHSALVGVKITTNRLGYIFYNLCNLDKFKVESEECFNEHHLKFADGGDKLYLGRAKGMIDSTIVFPPGLSCQHCVLRWTYTAGNNWGSCHNGTSKLGCGPQETFKNCADISIVSAGGSLQLPAAE